MIQYCPNCKSEDFDLGENDDEEETLNCRDCESEFVITEIEKETDESPDNEEEEDDTDTDDEEDTADDTNNALDEE